MLKILFFTCLFVWFLVPAAQAATTYSVALNATDPTDTYVTMRETTDQLAFIVSNTGTTGNIDSVKFLFPNSVYNTTTSASPPAGWSRSVTNTGSQSSITFSSSGSTIAPGASQSFPIVLKGDSNQAIPTSASNATDALASMVVKAGATTFTLVGGLSSWTRYGIKITSFTANPTTIGSGQNTTFTMNFKNVSSASQSNIAPGAMQSSGTGSLNAVSGPTPATVNNLAANNSSSFSWVYSGASGGTVTLSNTVGNGSVTAPSFSAQTVTIQTLSATMDVDPTTIPSGYPVTVTLTITNGSNQAITTVTPGTIATAGSAIKILIAGPTPSSVASLPAQSKAQFTYHYMIKGNSGQTYIFSNNATADPDQTTNTATSPTGKLDLTYVSVSPEYVGKGTTNQTLEFVCYNASGQSVKSIRIRAANTSFVATSANSLHPVYGTWSSAISGTDVTFTSPGILSNMPNGRNGPFQIRYASFPTPANDQTYEFDVTFTKQNNATTTFNGPDFLVSTYQISMAKNPDKNLSSRFSGTADITATLTSNGSAAANVSVNFSTTHGRLSASSAITDASGKATVTLTAPDSPTDIEATVTAAVGSSTQDITVPIDGTNPEKPSTTRERF